MKPKIDSTSFGEITVSKERYDHDIVIRLSGKVKKRKKKLSKERYGTSHTVSLEEAQHIYDEGAGQLILGTGQTGYVKLSEEAADFFLRKQCRVLLLSTPEAVKAWNESSGAVIAMFHVTC